MGENLPLKEELKFLIIKIVVLLGLIAVVFLFILGICRCSDDSMSPAFKNGDLAFFYRLNGDYDDSDVVVLEKDGETQIRRIIAKSGDTVNITKDGLEINGYLQKEESIFVDTLPYVEAVKFPLTVSEGEYFVLADNRMGAKDSRVYGTIKKKEIKGRVVSLIRGRGL